MNDLREEVKTALWRCLESVPEALRPDPDLYIEELTTAALNAIRGPLLANLGEASAAITAIELQIMDDCKPPDMGTVARL